MSEPIPLICDLCKEPERTFSRGPSGSVPGSVWGLRADLDRNGDKQGMVCSHCASLLTEINRIGGKNRLAAIKKIQDYLKKQPNLDPWD